MALHLVTLFAFVVSRPVLVLLADYPEYFVANKMLAPDIYFAVGLLIFAVPALLAGLVAVAGLRGSKAQLLVQTVFCAGLLSIFTLQLISDLSFIPILGKAIFVIFAFGVFCILYYKKRQFSLVITALSPVIVLFPVLFLLDQNIEKIMQAENYPVKPITQDTTLRIARKPPIVVVVFDEFPLVDLLNAEGQIDARRFPNFASLASQSVWYKNATTVSYRTQLAVPAILSGKRPKPGKLPIYNDYPNNLFSLLEGNYSFHVIEPITRLFRLARNEKPLKFRNRLSGVFVGDFLSDMSIVFLHIVLPDELTGFLPAVDDQWGGFMPASISRAVQKKRVNAAMKKDRVKPLASFITTMGSYPATTLHFIHVMLPHRPLQYLPSGRIYNKEKYVTGLSLVNGSGQNSTSKVWHGQQVLADRMHQRLLLQIGFVDKLLGQLVSEMKSSSLYEESLLIVVADHGISYQQNIPVRYPTPKNFGEIAFVPLFIKYPSQNRAKQEGFNVETIDILPTVIDVLGAEVSWNLDGRSLLDKQGTERPRKKIATRSKGVFAYTKRKYLTARQRAHEKNSVTFSLADPRSNLFHFEPGLDLIGTDVAALESERAPCSAQSDMVDELSRVDLSSSFLPTEIAGEIDCDSGDIRRMLLIVGANGVIQGVTQPYAFKKEILFNVVLSDEVLNSDTNQIELFVVWKQNMKDRDLQR